MEVEVKSNTCKISGVNKSGNSLQAHSSSEFRSVGPRAKVAGGLQWKKTARRYPPEMTTLLILLARDY